MKLQLLNVMLLGLFVCGVVTPSIAKDSKSDDNNCACLAGTIAFKAGQAGIYVNLPSSINGRYSVTVQATNTSGYSPTTACTYFNILKKTANQFQVQHKRCDDGVPVALDRNVSLDWIAIKH